MSEMMTCPSCKGLGEVPKTENKWDLVYFDLASWMTFREVMKKHSLKSTRSISQYYESRSKIFWPLILRGKWKRKSSKVIK